MWVKHRKSFLTITMFKKQQKKKKVGRNKYCMLKIILYLTCV